MSVWVCKHKISRRQHCDQRTPGGTHKGIIEECDHPCDAVEYAPSLDYSKLDRLMSAGHYFAYQDGIWHLFDKTGEGAYIGKSVSAIIKMICGEP